MNKLTGNRIYSRGAELARARSSVLGLVLVAGLVAAVGSLMLGYVQSAEATFPGTPGRIAYANAIIGGADSEIYTIRPDGGGRYQVTNNRVRQDVPGVEDAADIDPAYSPSGRRIAYVYYDGPHTVLYTIKPSGEDRRKVIDDLRNFDVYPAYSPGGGRIAYAHYDGNFDQIFTVKVDGTGKRKLTNTTSYAEAANCGVSSAHGGPTYSPDGETIAYTGWDGNDTEICTINTDGTGKRQLTHNDSWDRQPDYSPNGKRIAYAGTPGRATSDKEIYAIEADGGGKRRLTDDDRGQGNPSYSPNGERIAYDGYKDGDREIFTMRVGGGDKRQLTHNTTFDNNPSWGSR